MKFTKNAAQKALQKEGKRTLWRMNYVELHRHNLTRG